MSEIDVELNFTFPDKLVEKKMREIFLGVRSGEMSLPDDLKLNLLELFPSKQAAVQELFTNKDGLTDVCKGFLSSLEHVNTDNAEKVKLDILAGTGYENNIEHFMKFINSVGGTLLTCKAIAYGERTMYKINKRGRISHT